MHLLSCADPSRCGLLAVPTVELGLDAGGGWRRGRRGACLVIDRSSGEHRDTARWPEPPVRPDLTVVDACDPAWLEPAGAEAPVIEVKGLVLGGEIIVVTPPKPRRFRLFGGRR